MSIFGRHCKNLRHEDVSLPDKYYKKFHTEKTSIKKKIKRAI